LANRFTYETQAYVRWGNGNDI